MPRRILRSVHETLFHALILRKSRLLPWLNQASLYLPLLACWWASTIKGRGIMPFCEKGFKDLFLQEADFVTYVE